MKITVYIPDNQAKIYEDAKKTLGDSISKTFLSCLERALENAKLKTGRIVFELYHDDTKRTEKKAFEGRFVVGDENNPEEFYLDEEKIGIRGGGGFAVAVTKANRLIVFDFDGNENIIRFNTYDNFENLQKAQDDGVPRYPESLIQAVASELDIEHVEDLDI